MSKDISIPESTDGNQQKKDVAKKAQRDAEALIEAMKAGATLKKDETVAVILNIIERLEALEIL